MRFYIPKNTLFYSEFTREQQNVSSAIGKEKNENLLALFRATFGGT